MYPSKPFSPTTSGWTRGGGTSPSTPSITTSARADSPTPGGMEDIEAKRLKTVDKAKKVFGEDGLRLMRLCRFAGQLGFVPDEECLAGAKANAALIADISPERIFAELAAILHADGQYGVPYGHYAGLKLLEETGVLAQILPELALGKDMGQRKDFHKYDVLEHSLRAAKYADQKVRLSALLHDVGKPFCMLRTATPMPTPKRAGGSRGKFSPAFAPPSARRSVCANSSGCTCTTSTAGQSRENCGGFSCGTHPCSTTCSS